MRTFSQEPKSAQQTPPDKTALSVQARSVQSREADSILHPQPAVEHRAGAARAGHDFTRLPIQPPAVFPLQTKLSISEPGDKYEQEADRVAEQVMRTPEPQLQRACECGGKCSKCQTGQPGHTHERVQTSSIGSEGLVHTAAPSAVNEVLDAPGRPLDSGTRGFMEARFGHDFSQVRVHTGGAAEQSARDLHARAYTVGQNIVFGARQFAPGTSEGKKLLAHELTHVVQQTGAGGKKIDRSESNVEMSPVGAQPLIQRDLAIEPPHPEVDGRVLTPAQIADAITFNNGVLGSIDNSPEIIEMIRDVIGVSPLPAVVDEDFVNGIVGWQASFGLTQDGQLGPATARPLFREIGAEGVGRGEVLRRPRYTPAGPINVPRAGGRATQFNMAATFRSDPANGIFPSCCEIRQDMQWDAAFVAASVAAGNGTVPHAGFPAAHPAGTWIEDRNQGNTLRYGHREAFDRGVGNRYLDTAGRQNQAFGHVFEGQDNPQGLPADRGSWSFRLRAIDVCNGNQLLATSPTLVVNWL